MDPAVSRHPHFQAHRVKAFRIPPGDPAQDHWDKHCNDILWTGSLRVLTELGPMWPSARIKVELFNNRKFLNQQSEVPWAETYYVPLLKDGSVYVANDHMETVTRTDSPHIFRVVLQLPGTGFHPFTDEHNKKSMLQVALGLKIESLEVANKFAKSLDSIAGYEGADESAAQAIADLSRGMQTLGFNEHEGDGFADDYGEFQSA